MSQQLVIESFIDNNNRINNALQRLSLEANVTTDIHEYFTNTLPNFITDIKHRLNYFKTNTEEFKHTKSSKELLNKYKEVKKYIPSLDLLLFGEVLVTVPENFDGNLNKYIECMLLIYIEFMKIETDILNKYNLILSNFATNKEAKYSIKDYDVFFNKIRSDRERIVNLVKAFFPKDTGKTKKRLRDVLSRWNDLEDLVNNSAKLNTHIENTNVNNIINTTNKAVNTLDVILEQLKKNDTVNVNPIAAKNIANSTYEVAKYIELFGLLYHESRVAVYTVEKILDLIVEKK